jgi:hypothetical protein
MDNLNVAASGAINGFNLILWTDPIGNSFEHIGNTKRLMTPHPGSLAPWLSNLVINYVTGDQNQGEGVIAHMMGTVIVALKNNPNWANKLLEELVVG